MSQHSLEVGSESNGLWLSLTEYAVRSGVSTSTIRRKIKSNSILYRLDNGRYMILFNEKNNALARQPSPVPVTHRTEPQGKLEGVLSGTRPQIKEEKPDEERWMLPLMEKAVKMVGDAFEHTLKEKDERIQLLEKRNEDLEQRLCELKTLVNALEEKFQVRY